MFDKDLFEKVAKVHKVNTAGIRGIRAVKVEDSDPLVRGKLIELGLTGFDDFNGYALDWWLASKLFEIENKDGYVATNASANVVSEIDSLASNLLARYWRESSILPENYVSYVKALSSLRVWGYIPFNRNNKYIMDGCVMTYNSLSTLEVQLVELLYGLSAYDSSITSLMWVVGVVKDTLVLYDSINANTSRVLVILPE